MFRAVKGRAWHSGGLRTCNSGLFQPGLHREPRNSQLVQTLNAPALLAGAKVCERLMDTVSRAVRRLCALYVGSLFCGRKRSEDFDAKGSLGRQWGFNLSWWVMGEEAVETAPALNPSWDQWGPAQVTLHHSVPPPEAPDAQESYLTSGKDVRRLLNCADEEGYLPH